jgi:CRP/FNR family transcriptional regulator
MNRAPEINHDLRVLPCLSGLRDEDLIIIGRMSALKGVAKDDIVFQESEPMDLFFIVKTGSIKLYKTSIEGRELTIKVMRAGDYFCCAPLYAGGRYPVSAVSLEDSTLVVIPAGDFKEMLSNGVSMFGLHLIAGLCRRIKYLSNLVEDLTFKDVEQRVALLLLRLAEEKTHEDTIVSISITHQDIAAMTGTVREVVSRTITRLKKKGVITDRSVRGFKIDKQGLSKLLNKKTFSEYP